MEELDKLREKAAQFKRDEAKDEFSLEKERVKRVINLYLSNLTAIRERMEEYLRINEGVKKGIYRKPARIDIIIDKIRKRLNNPPRIRENPSTSPEAIRVEGKIQEFTQIQKRREEYSSLFEPLSGILEKAKSLQDLENIVAFIDESEIDAYNERTIERINQEEEYRKSLPQLPYLSDTRKTQEPSPVEKRLESLLSAANWIYADKLFERMFKRGK